MRRITPWLPALALLALVGCGSENTEGTDTDPAKPPETPFVDTEPGVGNLPEGGTLDDDTPTISDPGQPPEEEDVLTDAGGPADVPTIEPPTNTGDDTAEEPAEPAGDTESADDAPVADEPAEPGSGNG